jgi:hypothetical protein
MINGISASPGAVHKQPANRSHKKGRESGLLLGDVRNYRFLLLISRDICNARARRTTIAQARTGIISLAIMDCRFMTIIRVGFRLFLS